MNDDSNLLTAIDQSLMAAGDQRVQKARDEQVRAQECEAHGETREAELAYDYGWALRCQADGLWEAAAIVRRISAPSDVSVGVGVGIGNQPPRADTMTAGDTE
jgi:hypothetical protein